jgi:hypothetical protein
MAQAIINKREIPLEVESRALIKKNLLNGDDNQLLLFYWDVLVSNAGFPCHAARGIL